MRSLVLRKSDLEKLLLKNKKSPLFTQLADCCIEEGDVDKAIELCENGLINYPENPTAHYILGKCYYLQKRNKDAKSELERCLKYYPAFINAYKLLIEINKLDGLNQVVENLKHDMYLYSPLMKSQEEVGQINPEVIDEVDSGFEIVEENKSTELETESIKTEESSESQNAEISENIEADETNISSLIHEEDSSSDEKTEFFDEFELGDLNDKTDPVAEELGMVSDIDEFDTTGDSEDILEHSAVEDEFDTVDHSGDADSNVLDTDIDEVNEVSSLDDDDFEIVSEPEPIKEEQTDKKEEKSFFEITEEELFEDDPEHLEKLKKLKKEMSSSDTFRYDELNEDVKNEEIFNEKNDQTIKDEASPSNTVTEQIEKPIQESVELEKKEEKLGTEPAFIKSKIHKEGEIENIQAATDVLEHLDKEGNPVQKHGSEDELLEDELSILQSETNSDKTDSSQGIVSSTLGEIYLAQGQFQEALDVFKQLLDKEPENDKLKRKIKDISALLET